MNVELTKGDLNFVVSHLPKDIRLMMADSPIFLGGGFIRETISQQKPVDIDLFAPDTDLIAAKSTVLAMNRQGKLHDTPNAVTVLCPPRLPVQFIKRWLFDRPEMVLESFDFTVCQAVVWFERESQKWRSECSPSFYPDLAARRLVYTCPHRNEDAGGSLMRVRKFLSRGYNIQAESLAGVVARLTNSVQDMDKMDERKRAFVMSGLLREVDPLSVVDGVELRDEHMEVES